MRRFALDHLSLPVTDFRAGALAVIGGDGGGLVHPIPRVLFRPACLRSRFSSGVVVAVLVGWLCFVVSVGVCSVTFGHFMARDSGADGRESRRTHG
jgi:hypothetical protein